MKRHARLRRQADFRATLDAGRVYGGHALVAFGKRTDGPETRVGVTTSRNLKGAVDRNRARRRVREIARAVLLGPDSPLRDEGIRYDVVLIARPAALDVPFAELRSEAQQAAMRLSRLKP